MTKQNKDWERRLWKLLNQHYKKDHFQNKWSILRNFIQKELDTARKEERKKLIKEAENLFRAITRVENLIKEQ